MADCNTDRLLKLSDVIARVGLSPADQARRPHEPVERARDWRVDRAAARGEGRGMSDRYKPLPPRNGQRYNAAPPAGRLVPTKAAAPQPPEQAPDPEARPKPKGEILKRAVAQIEIFRNAADVPPVSPGERLFRYTAPSGRAFAIRFEPEASQAERDAVHLIERLRAGAALVPVSNDRLTLAMHLLDDLGLDLDVKLRLSS